MNDAQVTATQVLIIMNAWAAKVTGWDNAGTGIDLALYTNDHVPAPGDDISTYTLCTLTGASAKPTLVANVYSLSDGSVAVSLPTLASYTPLAEPGSPLTAYGWVAKNHAGGTLVAAARFDNPVQLHNGITVVFDVFCSAPLNWKFPNPVTP